MNQNDIRHYKEVYKNITVSDAVIEESWEQVSGLLPKRKAVKHKRSYRITFLFAGLLLAFTVGTVGAAQGARPGDTLYPVKVFSDIFVSKVTGKPEIIIQRRAEELIEESKHVDENQTTDRVEKAADAYEKTLDDSKKDVKGLHTDNEKLHDVIASQESKLKQVNVEHSQGKKIIEEAIDKTEKTKEAVNPGNNSLQDKEKKEQGGEHKNENSNNQNNTTQSTTEEKGNRK